MLLHPRTTTCKLMNVSAATTANRIARCEDEPLKTREEAARYWRVSLRTVDNLIADGRLPVVKVGRSVRIRPSDMRALGK